MRFRIVLLAFSSVLLLSSKCGKDPIEVTNTFDKSTLLANYADNVIMPRYQNLQADLEKVKLSYADLASNTTLAQLEQVQTDWLTAYVSFQKVQMFNFGPAMDFGLKGAFATFPTDTTKINQNSTNASWNLGTLDNTDAIGFPALDYLLFDLDQQTALSKLSNDNRYAYGLAIIEKMQSEVSLVLSNWNSNYKSTFKNSTGTSSTSSLSFLVNEFNKDFELSKNAKLAIPSGVQSLGIPRPEYIEAPFSGKSFQLLHESMLALHEVYKGGTGVGFDDYLQSFEGNGVELNTRINARFDIILADLSSYLNKEMKTEVESNATGLTESYNKIQAQVVNIKTDMPAQFGVFITYQDNDGD